MAPRIADSLKPACVWDKFPIHQGKQRDTLFLRTGKKPVPTTKTYRNPIREALELQAELESGGIQSQAELAKKRGVSRAKVTQALNLLKLDEGIRVFILDLDDTDERLKLFTQRRLRSLVQMSQEEQQRMFWKWTILLNDNQTKDFYTD